MLSTGNMDALKKLCAATHPATVAEFISALDPGETRQVLSALNPELASEVFGHLEEEVQTALLDLLRRDELARLLTHMAPDDRVDLLKRISEEKQHVLLQALAVAEREDLRRLASYKEGTVGSIMTTEYATLTASLTAREAIERLRVAAPDKETIYYAYIVDEARKLIGFVSLKDLILARPDSRVEDLMHRDVIFVSAQDDQETAAQMISKYDLLAVPVVNNEGAIIGIVTHDDAMDVLVQENQEDIEKFMAITGSHAAGAYLKTPSWAHFKNRVCWIVGLAALGLVSGIIIHSFEDTLTQVLILALYMPMVADTGGNTGSQSATVVVRALALGEIFPRDVFRVLYKEFKIAFLLAVILGSLSWLKVLFLSRSSEMPAGHSLPKIGAAIAIALGLQVITATLIGALLPLGAAKMKWDPAVVASPALTTIVDITGLLIYFTTAKAFLGL